MKNKLMIIDGNSIMYRAYFGSAYSKTGILKNSKGVPVNAVRTFYWMLEKFFREYNPTHLFIAFDAGSKTFRHEKLKTYKAGRKKTPEELIVQIPMIKEMLDAWGIKHFEEKMIEADDLAGSFAKKYSKEIETVVVSSDKDLLQLVDENISIVVPKNGNTPNALMTNADFKESVGCKPCEIPDLKGISGDASDNLKGVVGVGDKTTLKLIDKYGSLEDIYNNIEEINGKLKEKLINYKKDAFLCKEIATIKIDHPLKLKLEDTVFKNKKTDTLKQFFEKHEIWSIYHQIKAIVDEEEDTNKFQKLIL